FLDAVRILIVLERGVAAVDDVLEEILKAVFGNRAVNLLCAAALGEEMDRAEHGAVAELFTDVRDVGKQFRLIDFAEHFLPEIGGDAFHLAADRSVVIRQIGMASLRVRNAESKPMFGEIKTDLVHE